MNITETDKGKIQELMKFVADHINSVESVSIQLNSDFNVEPFIPYLLNDQWAQAVDPLQIADPNSEDDKMARANGILNVVIAEPIPGKFLDFGCGEGHVAVEAANQASFSIGYDPVCQNWNRFSYALNRKLTTSWEEVVQHAPYDTVLVYDVLDHLQDEEEAIESLKKIRSVLATNGRVFVRCHPWCSRHGTHLYLSINKAYLHFFFSDSELDKMGYKHLHTIKIINPLQTYQRWFKESGFGTPLSENIISEEVEPFFKQPAIAAIIKRHWRTSMYEDLASGKEFPEYQMRQCFVDYRLGK